MGPNKNKNNENLSNTIVDDHNAVRGPHIDPPIKSSTTKVIDKNQIKKEPEQPFQNNEINQTAPLYNIDVHRLPIRSSSAIRVKKPQCELIDMTSLNEMRLSLAMGDAGKCAAGVDAVEVWELADEFTGRLMRPRGGWWWRADHDNDYSSSDHTTRNVTADTSFRQLLENEPQHVIPGVDLVGELWSKISRFNQGLDQSKMSASLDGARKKIISLGDNLPRVFPRWNPPSRPSATTSNGSQKTSSSSLLSWRNISSMMNDPFISQGPRINLMHRAGFRHATAVEFGFSGHKGIVIYYSCDDINPNIVDLQQPSALSFSNETYMIRSAELIGAVVASNIARKACTIEMMARRKKTVGTASKLKDKQNSKTSNDNFDLENSNETGHSAHDSDTTSSLTSALGPDDKVPNLDQSDMKVFLSKLAKTWLSKCKGGNAPISPQMPWTQIMTTFTGLLLSLFLISSMNIIVSTVTDGETMVLMGPIGALVTLQYSLTAAPPSQPRNVIWGQAITGFIVMCFANYVPQRYLSDFWCSVIAPAVAVSVITKLGIPHPPAGGTSVLLASRKFGWATYGLTVAASALTLIPALLVNNLDNKREYPTHWRMFDFGIAGGSSSWRSGLSFKTKSSGGP